MDAGWSARIATRDRARCALVLWATLERTCRSRATGMASDLRLSGAVSRTRAGHEGNHPLVCETVGALRPLHHDPLGREGSVVDGSDRGGVDDRAHRSGLWRPPAVEARCMCRFRRSRVASIRHHALVLRVVASWLPVGFSPEDAPLDADEVVAALSFGTADDSRYFNRVGGIRCFRSDPMGALFIHVFSRSPTSQPGPITVDRCESRIENGTVHCAASALCGELQLTAVSAGIEEEDLLRAVGSLRVEPDNG